MELKEIEREPNPEIIIMLSGLLEKARRGEILSIATAYIDDTSVDAKLNKRFRGTDLLKLIGAVGALHSQLISSLSVQQN